jgi:prepilin peptidase CpaA
LSAVGGMGVGFVAFLPFYLLHGMAAGDVKMIATVGAFIGPAEAFDVAMLSWCVGGVMALLLVAFRGRLSLLLGNVGRMLYGALIPGVGIATPGQTSVGSMPYGVAIAIGTVTVLVRDYS